jgi:LysR family hydrogen peroxide-inducible transcriptional activator
VAVAEELSFRKAAERCHVSQPSLSAQLAELEAALGVQLFERDRRRVLLTSAGRELVARASRILLEVTDFAEAAQRAGDPLAGTLRIGVIPTVSPYLLPSVTPLLRAELERLTVAWLEYKTAALVQSLDNGAIDAAILALESEIGEVDREIIAEDPFILAAPPRHPIVARTSPAETSELRGTDVLLLDDGHCFRQQALAVCSKARAHELEFRATSLPTLVQMVAGGAGVTLLPALSIPTETDRAKLKLRRFATPAPHRTLALVWRRSSPQSVTLRRVAELIRRAYPRAARARDPKRSRK